MRALRVCCGGIVDASWGHRRHCEESHRARDSKESLADDSDLHAGDATRYIAVWTMYCMGAISCEGQPEIQSSRALRALGRTRASITACLKCAVPTRHHSASPVTIALRRLLALVLKDSLRNVSAPSCACAVWTVGHTGHRLRGISCARGAAVERICGLGSSLRAREESVYPVCSGLRGRALTRARNVDHMGRRLLACGELFCALETSCKSVPRS